MKRRRTGKFCYLQTDEFLHQSLKTRVLDKNMMKIDAANRRIFASVTAEEKEGEGGRRRKRRRGRKKERGRRKRRKEEGRRGGVHSPTRFHYSICVSNHVHRSLSPPAAAATAFRAELRYSIFFFPHLPFFYFRPPLPPLLPPPPPPAPPSPPLLPSYVFFSPPPLLSCAFDFC